MLGKGLLQKTTTLLVLFLQSIVFEKPVNNRVVDHLQKWGPFSDFWWFQSSQLIEDLLTVVTERIARAFNRFWPTRAVALDILKAFNRVWHDVFFRNLWNSYRSLMKFQVRYLALFFVFTVIDSFGWFWMGSLHKSIQLMLEFLKDPFFVLHFLYYTFKTFLMLSVKLLSTLNVVRHLICGNN